MNYKLSDREELVLSEFWKDNEVLTTMDLMSRLSNEFEYAAQLHKVINSLLKKELICVCGVIISGKKNARQFKAIISKEEFAAKMVIQSVNDKRCLARVALALVNEISEDNDPLELEDEKKFIHELEDFIDNYKINKKI